LKKGHRVGQKTDSFSFSLSEDSFDAHFIFTNEFSNETERIVYARANVKTKGFLKETLELDAEIDSDQIARFEITNSNLGINDKVTTVELNSLKFNYFIGDLDRLEQGGHPRGV
jgi:hypothetical protein